MADATTNAQRAANLLDAIDDARWPVAVDIAEKALNEAEDRGARQPMPADADTVEALRRLTREMLEPLRASLTMVPPDDAAALDHRANEIVQLIIANFHVRLIDEDEAEATEAEGEAGR